MDGVRSALRSNARIATNDGMTPVPGSFGASVCLAVTGDCAVLCCVRNAWSTSAEELSAVCIHAAEEVFACMSIDDAEEAVICMLTLCMEEETPCCTARMRADWRCEMASAGVTILSA